MAKRAANGTSTSSATVGFEAKLWQAADALGNNNLGRYVGAVEVEDDDEPFDEKMKHAVVQLREQQAEAPRLDDGIAKNLGALGYGL